MKLKSLRFERSWDANDPNLKGQVIFEGADSQIALTLTEEQAKRVMDICGESLQAELEKGMQAMKSALSITLTKRKDEKIGLQLPSQFT